MILIEQIEIDLIKALKAGEKEKLTVLRGLKSDIKYKQIDKGESFSNEDAMAVLATAAKKRKDSIEQFTNADRKDLADKETSELVYIQEYLPKQMDESELREIVKAAIEECGADSIQKVGLVMKTVMPKVKGKADGKMINKIALELLS